MNDEFDDPIIDATLDEVLGKVTPPDLSQRILSAWSDQQNKHTNGRSQHPLGPIAGAPTLPPAPNSNSESVAVPPIPPDLPVPPAGSTSSQSSLIPPPVQVLGGSGPALEPTPPPVAVPPSANGSHTADGSTAPARPSAPIVDAQPSRRPQARRSRSLRHWTPHIVVAGVLAIAAAISIWMIAQVRTTDGPDLVKDSSNENRVNDSQPGSNREGPRSNVDRLANGQPTQRVPRIGEDQGTTEPVEGGTKDVGASIAQASNATAGESGKGRETGGDGQRQKSPSGFDKTPPFAVADAGTPSEDDSPGRRRLLPNPLSHDEIVSFVNRELHDVWDQYDVIPAAAAEDHEWCRRLYLRVLGRIPTVAELERFVDNSADGKREQLVNQLLEDSQYADELADHWSGIWTNVLVGRTGGLRKNAPGDRQALQDWLRDGIRQNRPFDDMATDLISATGSTKPDADDHNAAVHFLLINMDEKQTLATSRTARALLGKQIQCTQCHHHPSNSWAQRHFWELNAFFRQAKVEREDAKGHYRLVDRDFRGEGKGRRDAGEAEVYFERLDGKLQAAYPVFLGRQQISPSGKIQDVNRRGELARLVTKSDEFSNALVNRLWDHFLGYGFTRVVDDMGPHNPASHPTLLKGLADQFVAHDHDLRSLMRWVVLSDAFGRSSRETPGTLADRPEAGSLPLFSRYYTRQLPPEEVFDSLRMVASARSQAGVADGGEQARLDWLGQFTKNMGTDDGTEIDTFSGDIRQSLIIMNGPLMRKATHPQEDNLLQRVLESKMSLEEKVEHLFQAALSRKPNRRENALIQKMLQSAGDQRVALQDVWWALLNSNEFILDH